MSDAVMASGTMIEFKNPCPRCGDLFYHPKTLIESEKQRAAEWEEIAIKREQEIASLKELIIQATPYVEYAVTYSTPLSQKLSEEWLEKTQERREK